MGDIVGISNGNYYSDRDVDALQGNAIANDAAALASKVAPRVVEAQIEWERRLEEMK